MKRFLALAMLLAACQSEAQDQHSGGMPMIKPPAELTQSCGADRYQDRIGQKPTDAMEWPKGVRIIRPGMAVTMDFRAERLNVLLAENGTIEQIRCG